MRVSVVYCTREDAWTREVELADGRTLRDAIEQSGVLAAHPALARGDFSVGVFGRAQPPEAQARDGDRIEIYRPLLVDPKDARRHRGELRRKRNSGG